VNVASSQLRREMPGEIEDLPVEPVENGGNVGIPFQLLFLRAVFVARDLAYLGEDAGRGREFGDAGFIERPVSRVSARLLALDPFEQAVMNARDPLGARQFLLRRDPPALVLGPPGQRAQGEPARRRHALGRRHRAFHKRAPRRPGRLRPARRHLSILS